MTRARVLSALLGLVLVAALAVGGGALDSAPPTPAQRAAAIEATIRCPSCEDLSVAVSSAPTAVAVRTTIRQQVAAGRTDRQITEYLAARYGAGIVLTPPASGWSLLVWVLPVAGVLAAALVLAVVLVRRRRSPGAGQDDAVALDPVALEDRRRFLAKSLADADAEFLAGDLSDRDYLALRQRDLQRLHTLDAAVPTGPAGTATARSAGGTATVRSSGGTATVRSSGGTATADRPADDPAAGTTDEQDATEDTGGELPARRFRPRRRWWFVAAAVACFAAAAVLVVSLDATHRLPGQTATGSLQLSPTQRTARTLDQAATLEDGGQLGQAAQLYQSVLTTHPDNEVALAQLGWLEYRIGQQGASPSLIADARAKLVKAAGLAPGDWAVHLYLGTVILQQDADASGAVDQFRQFLAAGPPPSVLQQAASVLRSAFQQAGTPLPPGVPAT